MKAFIIRLPEDLVAALKQYRQTTGTSAAEFVRRAIRLTLFADGGARRPIELARCAPDHETPVTTS